MRVKRVSDKTSSMRDLVFGAVAEYNRTCSSRAFTVKEALRKLIYNLRRAPHELVSNIRASAELVKWEFSAFTLDNLDGDYFVPGHILGGSSATHEMWKKIKAGREKRYGDEIMLGFLVALPDRQRRWCPAVVRTSAPGLL